MTFDIFALIYGMLVAPVLASVGAMNEALSAIVAPVLRYALIAVMVGSLLRSMFKPNAEPLSEFTLFLLGGAVALYMVSSSANYGTWARDVLLTGISQEIPNAIAGGTARAPITASSFMEIWGKAWAAGVVVYNNLPWSTAAIGLSVLVIFFWIAAAVATAMAFAIWIKAFIFLALLIGVGPLFAGLWVFPWTRGWFFGWLNTVVANIVLMALTVALLTLIVSGTSELLTQVAAGARTTGNEVNQLGMLVAGMILFGVAGWLAYQLPGTAAAITHGFAGYARSGGSRMGAMLMRAIPTSRSGGGLDQQRQADIQPSRAQTPPGASMSNP